MVPIDESLEATFVPGSHGRDGHLALWGPGAAGPGTIEIVAPGPDGPERRRVPAHIVSLGAAVDPLATLAADAPVRPSVRAWSTATQLALDLVARGRLLPSMSPDGIDRWRLGPLDATDLEHLDRLAAALPAPAFAEPVHSTGSGRAPELSLREPRALVGTFVDAVADTFVRTAAAAVAAGHGPYAAPDAHDVARYGSWLATVTSGIGGARAALRVVPPGTPDAPVTGVLEVRSHLDPGLVLSAAELWRAPPAVLERFGDQVDTQLLVTLRRASRVWTPVGRLLSQAHPDRLELEDQEAEELFGPVADDLAAAGLPVLWPAEVLRGLHLRPVVGTPRPATLPGSGLDLAAMAELGWRATIDGDELTERELAELAEAKRPMVRVRGRWVRADPEELARLRERHPVRLGDALAAALSGSLHVGGGPVEAEIEGPLAELAERLRAVGAGEDRREGIAEPDGLEATLRPYQRRGVAWLATMTELGVGGVLADDMGLGKTVQVLALHLTRRGRGPTLVICPATLVGNWEREAARFAPGVPVRRYHGAGRTLAELAGDEIVVASYGIVRRDVAELSAIAWDLVVADEAQSVKNPLARTARALRSLPGAARVALTGTPVENRLSDLWALLDWTTPGLLGPLDRFQRSVAVPVERDRDPVVSRRLAATVQPFLLRRRKTDPDVAPDLPPKTETDQFVGLTTEQVTLYRAVVAEMLDEVAGAEGLDRRGLVLRMLTALKQICNHPAHYLGQDAPLAGRSGKLDAAGELLGVATDAGDSALVFTQFVQMGRLLEQHLGALGIPAGFLHGSLPLDRRQEMVDAFQDGPPQTLVVSLRAGGTGLNLTRATQVVHFDRWWNPAVEDQASDRAWRIGQDRPVQVHRLICEGTLEERIATLLSAKRGLADSVVAAGETWLGDLSDDELADLVKLTER